MYTLAVKLTFKNISASIQCGDTYLILRLNPILTCFFDTAVLYFILISVFAYIKFKWPFHQTIYI